MPSALQIQQMMSSTTDVNELVKKVLPSAQLTCCLRHSCTIKVVHNPSQTPVQLM